MAPLAKSHRVLRWDVRGFGGSDKPAGPYHTRQFAADLAGLLDALDIDRVHLRGLSMGGVIAQRFALDHPERLRSLVLVSTSSEVGPRAVANWQRLADRVEAARLRRSQRRRLAVLLAPSLPRAIPTSCARCGEQVRGNDPRAYAAAARAVSDYSWTGGAATRRGARAHPAGPRRSTHAAGRLGADVALAARARLLMIPGAGHFLPLEEPVAFCAAVLAFTGAVDLLQPAARRLTRIGY